MDYPPMEIVTQSTSVSKDDECTDLLFLVGIPLVANADNVVREKRRGRPRKYKHHNSLLRVSATLRLHRGCDDGNYENEPSPVLGTVVEVKGEEDDAVAFRFDSDQSAPYSTAVALEPTAQKPSFRLQCPVKIHRSALRGDADSFSLVITAQMLGATGDRRRKSSASIRTITGGSNRIFIERPTNAPESNARPVVQTPIPKPHKVSDASVAADPLADASVHNPMIVLTADLLCDSFIALGPQVKCFMCRARMDDRLGMSDPSNHRSFCRFAHVVLKNATVVTATPYPNVHGTVISASASEDPPASDGLAASEADASSTEKLDSSPPPHPERISFVPAADGGVEEPLPFSSPQGRDESIAMSPAPPRPEAIEFVLANNNGVEEPLPSSLPQERDFITMPPLPPPSTKRQCIEENNSGIQFARQVQIPPEVEASIGEKSDSPPPRPERIAFVSAGSDSVELPLPFSSHQERDSIAVPTPPPSTKRQRVEESSCGIQFAPQLGLPREVNVSFGEESDSPPPCPERNAFVPAGDDIEEPPLFSSSQERTDSITMPPSPPSSRKRRYIEESDCGIQFVQPSQPREKEGASRSHLTKRMKTTSDPGEETSDEQGGDDADEKVESSKGRNNEDEPFAGASEEEQDEDDEEGNDAKSTPAVVHWTESTGAPSPNITENDFDDNSAFGPSVLSACPPSVFSAYPPLENENSRSDANGFSDDGTPLDHKRDDNDAEQQMSPSDAEVIVGRIATIEPV